MLNIQPPSTGCVGVLDKIFRNTPSQGHLFNFNSAKYKNRMSCREGLRLDRFGAQPPMHKSHAVLPAHLLPPSARGRRRGRKPNSKVPLPLIFHAFHLFGFFLHSLFPALFRSTSSLPLAPFSSHTCDTLIWAAPVFWDTLSPNVLTDLF